MKEQPVSTLATMTLDEAWAAAEAALPERWELALSFGRFGNRESYTAEASYSGSLRHYRANVGPARHIPFQHGYGPTPAAALQALVAKLTEASR